MSASSSKPPPPPHHQLHLHVDNTTSATAAANGSADSLGSESSSHSHSSRAPRPTPTATGGGGSGSGHQACAACKHQRRRCSLDCPLAPYFPADQKSHFLNAHRLFGVSNIQKTLRGVEPRLHSDAMRALIYESEARAADPVGGCVGIIEELRRQIHNAQTELGYVRHQIAIHCAASAPNNSANAMAGHQDNAVAAVDALYAAQLQPIPEGGSGLIFRGQQDYHALKVEEQNHGHGQQRYDYYFCYNNGAAGVEATSDDDGGMMQQQQYGFANVDGSGVKCRSPVALGEQLGHNCKIDAFNMKPELLPPATIQHHGPPAAGDVLHPEQEKLAFAMDEQQATAGAPCHLELGFSSFLSNNA